MLPVEWEVTAVETRPAILKLNHIVKRYFIGMPNELEILHNISLCISAGEFVSIVGESGSGKSTLMNIMGALDRPTSGSYELDGICINEANDKTLSAIRNQKIGFIFQTYQLLPRTTALSNVELPLLYAGFSKKARREKAMHLLSLVQMQDRASHTPEQLSGGQKQRVAIARAMANDPSLLLADEPTGALDSATGRSIMDLFHQLHEKEEKTIVLITHAKELASETDRMITLCDGHIVSEAKGGALCYS